MKILFTFRKDFWWDNKELLYKLHKSKKEIEETLRDSPYEEELTTDGKWFYQIVYWQILNGRKYKSTKVESSGTLEEIIEWLEHCGRVDEEYAPLHTEDTVPTFQYFQEKSKEFLEKCKECYKNITTN